MADPRLGWVPEPTGRGTASLIYNCIFTIFLCTWTAYHPDMPKPTCSSFKRFRERLGWMMLFISIPEVMVLLAMEDLLYAMSLKRFAENKLPEIRPRNPAYSVEFSLTHVFYFTSEAVVVETTDGVRRVIRAEPENNTAFKLIARGCPALFTISKEDILDKSKAEYVAKTITVLQTLWFLTQIIGRAAQRLPTSTLEIFTISIVISSLVSFVLWWHKPKDVSTPTVIRIDMTKEELDGILNKEYQFPWRRGHWLLISFITVFSSALSAGTPLLAWDFSFPTRAEHLMWIILSVVSCVVVAPLVVGMAYAQYPGHSGPASDLLILTFGHFIVAYVPLRLYFIIEAFVGLRSTPAGLYKSVDWSLYIPHL